MFDLRNPILLGIIEHTRKHGKCREAYTNMDYPLSLYIVKDDGAYLMSASQVDMPKPEGKGMVVAYAEGCRPEDGWIGGDDSADNVPLEWFEKAIAKGRRMATVLLTENEIKFKSL
jgi:hypothetical protein